MNFSGLLVEQNDPERFSKLVLSFPPVNLNG